MFPIPYFVPTSTTFVKLSVLGSEKKFTALNYHPQNLKLGIDFFFQRRNFLIVLGQQAIDCIEITGIHPPNGSGAGDPVAPGSSAAVWPD